MKLLLVVNITVQMNIGEQSECGTHRETTSKERRTKPLGEERSASAVKPRADAGVGRRALAS